MKLSPSTIVLFKLFALTMIFFVFAVFSPSCFMEKQVKTVEPKKILDTSFFEVYKEEVLSPMDAGWAEGGMPGDILEPEENKKREIKSMGVWGDSQACGASFFFKKLATKDSFKYIGKCVIGSRASQWTARIPDDKSEVNVVFLGSNDYEGNPKSGDYQKVASKAKKNSDICIFVGPPAIRGTLRPKVLKLIQEASELEGCVYFDTISLNLELPDGIHPSQKEFSRWADEVYKIIQSK